MCQDLKRSKRQRQETSFENDFYTYIVGNDPTNFSKATSAPNAKHWVKVNESDSIKKDNT